MTNDDDARQVIWDWRSVNLVRVIRLVLAGYATPRAGYGIWRSSRRHPGATFRVTWGEPDA